MHELAIAASILEAAQRETALRKNAPLQKIGVRVGELSAVDPEALRFGFEMLTRSTNLEAVELQLEFISRTNACADCSTEFAVKDFDFRCPACGGENTHFVRGDELEVAYLELEEA